MQEATKPKITPGNGKIENNDEVSIFFFLVNGYHLIYSEGVEIKKA